MQEKDIGNLGEAKVLVACLQLGLNCYLPYGDGNHTDLIIEKDNKIYKAQIKTSNTLRDGYTGFYLNGSNNRTKSYKGNIDFFLLCSLPRNKIYLVPIEEAPTKEIKTRFQNGNNLSRKEEDYLFENQIQKY